MAVAPISGCTHCGSDKGFYTKDYVVGKTQYNHNFDGSEADNGQYYEAIKHKQGEHAYCRNCNKRLFPMSEFK
jgi:hypothetical protein